MTDLADLSATDLLAAYKTRSLSPVDVVSAVLDRVGVWDKTLNALWTVETEAALAAARASEKRWAEGHPVGALDGVTVTLKENIATKGTATPMGTAATELVAATQDSPVAARLREAGAILLGKTTMPDYGMLPSGLSSFHRLARNPWNTRCNPGGSSAGAGAAAAAGYGPLHLGTDIGGSVRLPAGWCGVAGFKPSFGRVPVDPPYLGRAIGPITRTVADMALLMGVLSGPDPRDYTSLPAADIDWHDLEMDLSGLRIGLLRHPGIGMEPEPAMVRAAEAAARLFAAHGAVVEDMKPFMAPEMLHGLDQFWRTRSWSDYVRLPPERKARVLPFIREWIEAAEGMSGLDVYRGTARMFEISAASNHACNAFDYVISPTSPVAGFPAEWPCPTNDVALAIDHIGFTVAFNMSEQPAISVNGGYTDSGMPIGLQIAGRRFDDVGVLRMARAWERMRPEQRAWPRLGR